MERNSVHGADGIASYQGIQEGYDLNRQGAVRQNLAAVRRIEGLKGAGLFRGELGHDNSRNRRMGCQFASDRLYNVGRGPSGVEGIVAVRGFEEHRQHCVPETESRVIRGIRYGDARIDCRPVRTLNDIHAVYLGGELSERGVIVKIVQSYE